jgi:sterol desaturase/sphingolipid hydroxylase (fatty acid hydroxylase superfamily)
MLKSQNPPPIPFYPLGLDLKAQARTARRELYPVTLFYLPFVALALGHALLDAATRLPGAVFFLSGVALWTLVEYLVHRYVLHPPFPDGPGALRHAVHVLLDGLHWEHHERPWDGNNLSGSVSQTLPVFAVLLLVSLLTPLHTGPVLLAGLALGYVGEEWVHYSIHFERLPGGYAAWSRRNHLRHHASPSAEAFGLGITSSVWDVVCGTRLPEPRRNPSAKTPGDRAV